MADVVISRNWREEEQLHGGGRSESESAGLHFGAGRGAEGAKQGDLSIMIIILLSECLRG